MGAEQLPQWPSIDLRHHKEIAAFKKQAIGHQSMKVEMPAGVITNSVLFAVKVRVSFLAYLYGYDNSWDTGFLAKDKFEEFRQNFGSALTELAQQFTIIQKEPSQYLGNGKNILPMRYGIKNRLFEMMAKLNYFFVMTGGTEPASSADESKEIFVLAIRAFDTSKALMQIAAFKIFINYMRYNRSVKAILLVAKFVISPLKFNKMAIEEFPQGGFLRLSPPVYFHLAAAFHMAPLFPARGIL